jgi:serine/threonine protein kinase
MRDPSREPGAVAARLIAALADGRRPPRAVLDDHARLSDWDARDLDELTRAFDAANAAERLPEPVLATVRGVLQRLSRDARNSATDQMPAMSDSGDWTEEIVPPDECDDTTEIDSPTAEPPAPACLTAPPAHAPDVPLVIEPGVVLCGRYELLRRIGRGGTAVVHLARDLRRDGNDGRDAFVAIKSRKPSVDSARAAARLKQEFRQARALSHPGIVRVHDLDRDGEQWFMTMEWIDGESLAERIQRAAPLPVDRALRIARACAQALAFAHGRGIVHGDFKPSNIMIDTHDDVRLLDFGAAPDSSSCGDGEPQPAGNGRCLVTRCYASPEVLAGEPPTARDDVFSLACVVYELLSGAQPFRRRGADRTMLEHASVAPVAALSPAQNAALATGLAWRREDRPFGALELLDAMEAPDSQRVVIAPAGAAELTKPAPAPTVTPLHLRRAASTARFPAPLIALVAATVLGSALFLILRPPVPVETPLSTPAVSAINGSRSIEQSEESGNRPTEPAAETTGPATSTAASWPSPMAISGDAG